MRSMNYKEKLSIDEGFLATYMTLFLLIERYCKQNLTRYSK
jgi:hypothetical protein